MQVLVVEDDVPLREALSRFLKFSGFEGVLQVSDGVEALSLLKSSDKPGVDLIITDLDMPRMDGMALTRQLRQNGSSVPVIMISGRMTDGMSAAAYQAGVSSYLEKPTPPEMLLHTIRHALKGGTGVISQTRQVSSVFRPAI